VLLVMAFMVRSFDVFAARANSGTKAVSSFVDTSLRRFGATAMSLLAATGCAALFRPAPALVLLLSTGCTVRTTQFRIIDYRDLGRAEVYTESFDEAYYRIDEMGNVDVVLRRRQPGIEDPRQTVTQVVHLSSMWRPIPGRTVADRTQINGTVSYLITSGQVGAAFEGAGSMFYNENRKGTVLTGTLERAYLTPQRCLNGGRALFTRAELSGQFRAARDPRRVARILNETQRLFGPIPRYQPPSPG